MKKNENIFKLVLTALFLSIMLLLAFVPFLGFIPIGPIQATTLHLPVIIASIVLGPKTGGFLGGCFGLISMIRNTVMITPMSFAFSPFIAPLGTDGSGSWKALLVVFIPRILIGIVPYFVYRWGMKLFKQKGQGLTLFIAGLSGGVVNTVLVMNLIYFLFKAEYADVLGKAGDAVYWAILGVILTQGIPEAIIGGLACAGVSAVLLKFMQQRERA